MKGVGSAYTPVVAMFRVLAFKGESNPTTVLFRLSLSVSLAYSSHNDAS